MSNRSHAFGAEEPPIGTSFVSGTNIPVGAAELQALPSPDTWDDTLQMYGASPGCSMMPSGGPWLTANVTVSDACLLKTWRYRLPDRAAENARATAGTNVEGKPDVMFIPVEIAFGLPELPERAPDAAVDVGGVPDTVRRCVGLLQRVVPYSGVEAAMRGRRTYHRLALANLDNTAEELWHAVARREGWPRFWFLLRLSMRLDDVTVYVRPTDTIGQLLRQHDESRRNVRNTGNQSHFKLHVHWPDAGELFVHEHCSFSMLHDEAAGLALGMRKYGSCTCVQTYVCEALLVLSRSSEDCPRWQNIQGVYLAGAFHAAVEAMTRHIHDARVQVAAIDLLMETLEPSFVLRQHPPLDVHAAVTATLRANQDHPEVTRKCEWALEVLAGPALLAGVNWLL